MKTTLAIALSLAAFLPFAVHAKPVTLKADTKESGLAWTGKKITGASHSGSLKLKKGELKMDGDALKEASFDIDMQTLANSDLTDEGMNKKLVGHLKSDDFFSVDKHPTASFKTTKVEKLDGGKYNVTGDLTIKGIKHSVTFPAQVTSAKDKLEATAQVSVDRTKWDVRYGSGKFFQGLGDKMINDEFTVDVKLVAKK